MGFFDKIKKVTRIKGKAPQNPHVLPLRELQRATNKFDERQIIGSGGFGNVYIGILKNGTRVAVKRKKRDSKQGEKEFQAEIEQLSRLKLNHPSLVSTIGYCDEKDEMILVYEYMEEGNLKSRLYGSDKPSLNWEQRLVVSVGAAKGLHFLHTSSPEGTIHRDVKPENILLDENLCAKVGDFGLLKVGPDLGQTHVSTKPMGSFGYIDPEYWQTEQLTAKSDVYSFGVVLLEILSGRPVGDPTLSGKGYLVCWGKEKLEKGQLEEIVDQKIFGTTKRQYLTMFGDIVLKCLAEKRADRPMMEEVLRDLEFLHASTRVPAANSDESYHDSISVAAGNTDESDHDATSRLVGLGEGKALTRSLSKAYDNMAHDPSAPSTSRVYQVSGGNTMNGFLDLHSIQESICEAGNSHESDHDFTHQPIRLGKGKTLRRSLGEKNLWGASSVADDLHGPSTSQVPSPVLDESISTVAGNSDESSDDDGVYSQPKFNPGERRALIRCPRM